MDFELVAELTRDRVKLFEPKSTRKGGPEAYLMMHKVSFNVLKIIYNLLFHQKIDPKPNFEWPLARDVQAFVHFAALVVLGSKPTSVAAQHPVIWWYRQRRVTASPAAARAMGAFQAAFAKMRRRAEEKARNTALDDLATLRGRIAEATEQIGDAAGLLPGDRGGRLKMLHETLTKGLRKIGLGIARERNEDHRKASVEKKNPTVTGD